MAYFVCASCKSRVEDGAVVCHSCRASLSPPGAFMQTLGWVIALVSLVPFSVGEVTAQEGNFVPVILGAALAVLGIICVVVGRGRNRAAAPAVTLETPDAPGKS